MPAACACWKEPGCRRRMSTVPACCCTFMARAGKTATCRCLSRHCNCCALTGARTVQRCGCSRRRRGTVWLIAWPMLVGQSPAVVCRVLSAEPLQRSGINKRAHVHTLRHSYATYLLEAGVNLRLIQDNLGHRSPRTTALYTHLAGAVRATLTAPLNQLMRDL